MEALLVGILSVVSLISGLLCSLAATMDFLMYNRSIPNAAPHATIVTRFCIVMTLLGAVCITVGIVLSEKVIGLPHTIAMVLFILVMTCVLLFVTCSLGTCLG